MSINQEVTVQPARVIYQTTPHRTIGGLFFRGITPLAAEYESYNERNTIQLLALCHDVFTIKSQPIKLEYLGLNGEKKYHIPDLEVLTASGSLYLEIKAIENLILPKNLDKYCYIAKQYFKHGLNFRFLTNIQIEKNLYLILLSCCIDI